MSIGYIISNLFGGGRDSSKEIQQFTQTIRVHEDQLFGIKLYFEGVNVLYSGQPDLIEANKRSFHNTKERSETAIATAKLLLEEVKKDPSRTKELRKFQFPPIQGHPVLDQMTQRAKIIIKTYERLFPDRPRNIPLSQDELTTLMTEASNQL